MSNPSTPNQPTPTTPPTGPTPGTTAHRVGMVMATGPTPIPSRPKYTRQAIERRRLEVWEMLCCGRSMEDIAKSIKVSYKTVQRDKEWWEERLGYDTEQLKDPKHAAIDVGMTRKRLEKIFEDAYVEYAAATNGAFKARFLQTAVQALVYRHKIGADAGFLPKVGHEKEQATKVEINFTQRFGPEAAIFEQDPKSRRKVLEAFQAIIKERSLADKPVLGLPMHTQGDLASPPPPVSEAIIDEPDEIAPGEA